MIHGQLLQVHIQDLRVRRFHEPDLLLQCGSRLTGFEKAATILRIDKGIGTPMTAASAPMPTEITSAELALLALSNPREVSLGTKYPIALTTKESGQVGLVGVYRNSYTDENYQFRSQSPVVQVPTSDLSGTMQLKRSGSMVSGYHSDGGPFLLIGSALSTPGPTGFVIDFATPSPTAQGNLPIVFDTFKVNSGTVVCPQ